MTIEPYKGVRDFYPEDQRIQNYIFAAMRRAVESFGYEEMNASILESTELYSSKTSEEIVREQTYTFTDRGERSVTLRPEMTPTVARMVAARKRELGFPLRWYSIQNFFRYERPQRGRLREFWQLNADLFGVAGIDADAETIAVASRVMTELGAKDSDFAIHIGSRNWLDALAGKHHFSEEKKQELRGVLDKRAKMGPKEFESALQKIGISASDIDQHGEPEDIAVVLSLLSKRGIRNAIFDPGIVRGFDYYTGMVFEVFDTNPENSRSMFGGGRYDNLVGQYLSAPHNATRQAGGNENVPAVGFAMGDVIARDFLETHTLLPNVLPASQLYLAPVTEKDSEDAALCADTLRRTGLNVTLGGKHEKIADHIKAALKLGIPYFAAYGEKEKTSGIISLKELRTEKEKVLPAQDVASYIGTNR